MEEDLQEEGKTDNPFIVFLVGLTAGYIATTLPPLITYLSVSEQSLELSFFSGEYFYASSLFAVVIGISMVWLNYGKKETTKNLFMTALALPSVISGAVNMSSTTVNGEASLKEMESHSLAIEKSLQEVMGVSDVPVLNFVGQIFEEVNSLSQPNEPRQSSFAIPFINDAYAAEDRENESASMAMGIQFDSRTQQKNYIVIVDQSDDLDLMKTRLESYSQVLLISNLKIKRTKSTYYIIQDIPRTKSFSLIEVLRLNKNYGLQASLAKIK